MPYAMGPQDYQPKADAEDLRRVASIKRDGKRHKAAMKEIESKYKTDGEDVKVLRKEFEKKTKRRMNKVFRSKQDEKTAPQLNQDTHGIEG